MNSLLDEAQQYIRFLLITCIFFTSSSQSVYSISAPHLAQLESLLHQFPVLLSRCRSCFFEQFCALANKHLVQQTDYQDSYKVFAFRDGSDATQFRYVSQWKLDWRVMRSLLVILLPRAKNHKQRAHDISAFLQYWLACMPQYLLPKTCDETEQLQLPLRILCRAFEIYPELLYLQQEEIYSLDYNEDCNSSSYNNILLHMISEHIDSLQHSYRHMDSGQLSVLESQDSNVTYCADEMWKYLVAAKCFDRWSDSGSYQRQYSPSFVADVLKVLVEKFSQLAPKSSFEELLYSNLPSSVPHFDYPWTIVGTASLATMQETLADSLVAYFETYFSLHAELSDQVDRDSILRCLETIPWERGRVLLHSPLYALLAGLDAIIAHHKQRGVPPTIDSSSITIDICIYSLFYLCTTYVFAILQGYNVYYDLKRIKSFLQVLVDEGKPGRELVLFIATKLAIKLMKHMLSIHDDQQSHSIAEKSVDFVLGNEQHGHAQYFFLNMCSLMLTLSGHSAHDIINQIVNDNQVDIALNWGIVFYRKSVANNCMYFSLGQWLARELLVPFAIATAGNACSLRDNSLAVVKTLKARSSFESLRVVSYYIMPAIKQIMQVMDQQHAEKLASSALCRNLRRLLGNLCYKYESLLDESRRMETVDITRLASPDSVLSMLLLVYQQEGTHAGVQVTLSKLLKSCEQTSGALPKLAATLKSDIVAAVFSASQYSKVIKPAAVVRLLNTLRLSSQARVYVTFWDHFVQEFQFESVPSEINTLLRYPYSSALAIDTQMDLFLSSLSHKREGLLVPDTHELLLVLLNSTFRRYNDQSFLAFVVHTLNRHAEFFSRTSLDLLLGQAILGLGTFSDDRSSEDETIDNWRIFAVAKILYNCTSLIDLGTIKTIFKEEVVCRLVQPGYPVMQLLRQLLETQDKKHSRAMRDCTILNYRLTFLAFNNAYSGNEQIIVPKIEKASKSSVAASSTSSSPANGHQYEWSFDPWKSDDLASGVSYDSQYHPQFSLWFRWLVDCSKVSESIHTIYLAQYFGDRTGYLLAKWFSLVCLDSRLFAVNYELLNTMYYLASLKSTASIDGMWPLFALYRMPTIQDAARYQSILATLDLFSRQIISRGQLQLALGTVPATQSAIDLLKYALNKNGFLVNCFSFFRFLLVTAHEGQLPQFAREIFKLVPSSVVLTLVQELPYPVLQWMQFTLDIKIPRQSVVEASRPGSKRKRGPTEDGWAKMDSAFRSQVALFSEQRNATSLTETLQGWNSTSSVRIIALDDDDDDGESEDDNNGTKYRRTSISGSRVHAI